VLGVLPAVIGSIQAVETIKLILGKSGSLSGRLLLFDALKMTFRVLEVRKSPECPACGPKKTIHEPIDYEAFCGVSGAADLQMELPEITALELKARIDEGHELLVVDVREPHEHQICQLDGILIPMADLPSRIHELDSSREIVVYCSSGARSASAVQFLRRAGFDKVWHLRGGIFAWSDDVDPGVPKY
jgi:adenylyltransferase/sulfurtransferase